MKKKQRWSALKFFKNVLILGVLAAAAFFVYTHIVTMQYPLRYEYYISSSAAENNLDKFLVAAVIRTESNFIHDADSGKAKGLMQLTDETAKWVADKMGMKDFKPEDVNVPEINIKMGCWYLKYLIDMYKNTDTALAAYNGGMGNVSRWLKDERYSSDGKTLKYIPFEETREYVKRVNKYRGIYAERYHDAIE